MIEAEPLAKSYLMAAGGWSSPQGPLSPAWKPGGKAGEAALAGQVACSRASRAMFREGISSKS